MIEKKKNLIGKKKNHPSKKLPAWMGSQINFTIHSRNKQYQYGSRK
jgi:hypothetical protein